mgnify:CR=1 FL=1
MYDNIKTEIQYNLLLESGMFWVAYPELCGVWAKDKLSINVLGINVVSVSLPTDPIVLAEYLHAAYETIAKKTNWNTQENCKVPFKDLPNENKTTMILLAGKLILDFGCNER